VYHSLGKAAEAIAEYTRVADKYLDAKQAIEYFTRKGVGVPEVTNVKPGDPAAVDLKFRNVPSVDVKAYRIDLMKFGLLRRDLGDITAINLAGVRPYFESAIKLGDGKDYRDRTHKLTLPLKEAGAYLVVCRAEDLYSSGLVLVTPLAVEVQEEAESGRVRTTVKDVVKDRYVPEVQIKAIGSHNPDFVSGATDLRGVFVADGIAGRSTIIARADAGYAFYRGKDLLGSVHDAPNPPPGQAPAQKPQMRQEFDNEAQLLDNLRNSNRAINDSQQNKLKNLYENSKKGIDAKSAY
jgi:hypothetical protein